MALRYQAIHHSKYWIESSSSIKLLPLYSNTNDIGAQALAYTINSNANKNTPDE